MTAKFFAGDPQKGISAAVVDELESGELVHYIREELNLTGEPNVKPKVYLAIQYEDGRVERVLAGSARVKRITSRLPEVAKLDVVQPSAEDKEKAALAEQVAVLTAKVAELSSAQSTAGQVAELERQVAALSPKPATSATGSTDPARTTDPAGRAA
jgi:hypothetical protein